MSFRNTLISGSHYVAIYHPPVIRYKYLDGLMALWKSDPEGKADSESYEPSVTDQQGGFIPPASSACQFTVAAPHLHDFSGSVLCA